MHKTMVFIDYQNFNITLQGQSFATNVNYNLLAKNLNEQLPFKSEVMKTYLFAYKPEDELLQLDKYKKYYDWLQGLYNVSYLEIIEGRQVIRKIKDVEFSINDSSTYTTEEKGTDINLAAHMITKAYQNAYDIAILVSGDTDYLEVVKILHNLGKIVVIAHFPGQNTSRYNGQCDAQIIINKSIIEKSKNVKESK